MPPSIDNLVKGQVIQDWLSGSSRDEIAIKNRVGAGTVSNIISQFKSGLENYDYKSIRELAVQLKKEGLTYAQIFSVHRRHNYIEKLGANDEEIESLIANLVDKTKCIPIEKTVDSVNQMYEISNSENIPPAEVAAYINQKIEEKKILDKDLQKSRAILDQERVDVQNLNEYKKSKEQLKKYGFSTDSPHKLLSVLQSFNEMGYNPQRIVRYYKQMKSLKQKEWRLRNYCKLWESRAAEYQKIVPMCKHVVSMGIGIPLLLALETAVIKKIEVDGIPAGAAPYRILEEIDDYKRLGGVKKQLYDAIMQLSMASQIMARQERVINTLTKLQMSGMTEGQILNACQSLEVNGSNSSPYSNNSHFG